MAVKWTRDRAFLRGELTTGTPAASVMLEQIDGDTEATGTWCIRVKGDCICDHVTGLKRAKIRGARYLVGCLKPKK